MALNCARHHKFPATKEGGNAAMPPTPTAYVSAEAHYSFLKAVSVIGLGRENLVKVPTTATGAMCVDSLREAVKKTRASGGTPFFVGCTAGSTVRGTFDPFDEVADVCKKEGMWMHVDGAWGGPAVFSRRDDMRALMKGVERSDR